MGTPYEKDVVAWAMEQAALLRAGKLSAIDIEHIADEIEDVAKSEKRELARRVSELLAHLLRWQHQPGRRCSSWTRTIKEQRRGVAAALEDTPSLRASLADERWLRGTWSDAVTKAIDETGLDDFPEVCPWAMDLVLSVDFFPEA
ncbi:MAG: hypothetical protein RLZZ373_2600 [Pseudomonadota bacterium]|jgi:hypothetical protein